MYAGPQGPMGSKGDRGPPGQGKSMLATSQRVGIPVM